MDQGVVIENSSENIEVSADMTGGVSIEDAGQGVQVSQPSSHRDLTKVIQSYTQSKNVNF